MDSGQSMWEDSEAEGKALLPLPWPLLTLRTGALDTGHTPEGKPLTGKCWPCPLRPRRLVLSSCSLPFPE